MAHISELKVYLFRSTEFYNNLDPNFINITELCLSPLYIVDKGILYCLSYLDEVDILLKFPFEVELITHFRLLDIRKNLYYGNINILYEIIEQTYLERSPVVIRGFLDSYIGLLYGVIASILHIKENGNPELKYDYSILSYLPDNIIYQLQYSIADVNVSLYKDDIYRVNFKCDLDLYRLISLISKYYIKITPINPS